MTITLPASLLAIDFGGLMAVVFVIFTVLSWISSAVGNQQKPPRPAGQPPRGGGGPPRPPQARPQAQARARNPRQEQLESEIEAFLQEVVQPRPNAPRAEREIEVVEPEPPREPPRRPTPRREAATARREAPPRRPGQREPERVEPADQHVSLHAELSETTAPHVATGTFADAILVGHTGRSTASPVRPADIAALLRSPQGVQQAVLMSEILARPRSLQ